MVFFHEWNEWKNPQFNFSSQDLSIERNFFKWDGKVTKISHLLFHRIWRKHIHSNYDIFSIVIMIENWESPQSASISNHKKSGNNEDDFRSKFLRSRSASLLSHKKSTNGEDFCSKFVRWDILTTESIKILLRRNNIYNHKMYIYLYYIFLHDFIKCMSLPY